MGLWVVPVLALSLGLTLVLEEAFGWLAGVRAGWDMALIGLVNILTNPAVVFLYYVNMVYVGWDRKWTAACLCALCAGTALADVIWTPEDSFYEQNYDSCTHIGRRYYANGPKGYVAVVKEPGSEDVLDFIPNGEIFYVSVSYDKKRMGPGAWSGIRWTKTAGRRRISARIRLLPLAGLTWTALWRFTTDRALQRTMRLK